MDGENRVAGLDEWGLPAFYTVGGGVESSLEGGYRLTRGDIERGTLLIPDISMIRKGDLLVRYDVSGEPHIGIVAGLGWSSSNGPEWGAEARDWWTKVFVVSVRRGYRTVSLGSWGNSSTVFGGFSETPESYQIRRLLVKRDDAAQQNAEPPEWELVDEVAVKLRQDYPPENNVPRVYTKITLLDLQTGSVNYYRELPSTSFNTKVGSTLFSANLGMRVPCFTGWRTDETGYTSYHRGVDLNPDTAMVNENEYDFFAPEDGLFWIFKSKDLAVPENITFPSSIMETENNLRIDKYSSDVYGFIGVLLTRPDAPREGRVYVFSHMGEQFSNIDINAKPRIVPETDANTAEKLSYASEYEVKTSDRKYPQGPENAIRVRAGDWLGKVGNRGKNNSGAHIHLEVYEFFENGSDENSAKWQRVEPLSVFSEHLFDICYNNGGTPQVKKTYGWWARKKGNVSSFTTQAAEYVSLQNMDGADAPIRSWSQGAIDNWISVLNYSDFPDLVESVEQNRFENVFLPDAWDRKKQPGYSEE